jgi:hypothetical protein
MNSFVLSPEAEEDIFEIWSYLASAVNVKFADQVESELSMPSPSFQEILAWATSGRT